MRRYWMVLATMLGVLLALFAAVEALGVPLLTDPAPWLDEGGWSAAVVGVVLLLADVVLPVPSSLLMIAHGAAFGVPLGALLSVVGSTGSAMLAFAIGRKGGPLLERFVSEEEWRRADALLRRYGTLAIVATRPIPLLAETTAIIAGTSSLRPGPMALAALVGSVPAALLYAVAGALAVGAGHGLLVFGAVLVIAAAFWLVTRRLALDA